jgi:protein required for attachment to host cells
MPNLEALLIFWKREIGMKPTKTWIVIADSRSAKILENSGPGEGIVQHPSLVFKVDSVKQYSDQQGRSFASASSARHKFEQHQGKDPTILRYIDEIISTMQKANEDGEFDRLVVCASPEVLHIVRRRMPKQLKSKIVLELDKNLANISLADLPKQFEDVLVL